MLSAPKLASPTKCVKQKPSPDAATPYELPVRHHFHSTYLTVLSVSPFLSCCFLFLIMCVSFSLSLLHKPYISLVTVMASDSSEHDDMARSHPVCRRGNPYEINITHTHSLTHSHLTLTLLSVEREGYKTETRKNEDQCMQVSYYYMSV